MITQRHEQTLCRPDYTVGATVYASVYKCTSRLPRDAISVTPLRRPNSRKKERPVKLPTGVRPQNAGFIFPSKYALACYCAILDKPAVTSRYIYLLTVVLLGCVASRPVIGGRL